MLNRCQLTIFKTELKTGLKIGLKIKSTEEEQKKVLKRVLKERLKRYGPVLTVWIAAAGLCTFCGCGGGGEEHGASSTARMQETKEQPETEESGENQSKADQQEESMKKDYGELFRGITLAKGYKGIKDENPIMTQRFGADPYAMVYGDKVYFYMTADTVSYDAAGNPEENTYGNINKISVVSTEDMVNFTDHGEIAVAGRDGAAKWASNSWAPAAAWKMIDGKPRFFLYFADAGGGIGVLTADDPAGPFVDELGHGLITRDMPNCSDVLWLFDPAVLVDDDGRAYLYFGGGVPENRAADPGTGRAVELGEDMMSIVGEPVVIDAPYLFEDSGIHKWGNKYYYTYCSNWQVDEAGTEKYGFQNADIVCLESESPLGPYTFKEVILKNPGQVFGLYGNNHHCVFCFKDQWYITYHTRLLEQKMGMEKGYRCTHIDEFTIQENGQIGQIKQTYDGRSQRKPLDLYQETSAATSAVMAGVETVPSEEGMVLGGMDTGSYVKLEGVDLGAQPPEAFKARIYSQGEGGVIRVTPDVLNGEAAAYLEVPETTEGFAECRAEWTSELTGVHDLYFTFYGKGYQVSAWQLEQ